MRQESQIGTCFKCYSNLLLFTVPTIPEQSFIIRVFFCLNVIQRQPENLYQKQFLKLSIKEMNMSSFAAGAKN